MNKLNNKKNCILIFSTVILGVIAGFSSLFLSLLLDGVERVFLGFQESAANPASLEVMPVHRLLSVFLGGIIAAVIWWALRTRFKATVPINKALSGAKMPPVQTAIHVMTQIFYVGTGGSVGRELAPREAGAMLAQSWNGLLKKIHLELSADDQKLLIAAAAGAGFAGIYSAPLTGMFFCVEILLKKITKKTVAVSLIMSTISMLIGTLVKGFGPYYLVGQQKFPLDFLVFVVIVSPLCGIIGSIFRKAFKWAGKHQTKNKNILWQLPAIALITGIISIPFPQIMGNGRALAQLSIDNLNQKLILVFLIEALLKAIVTVFTIKAGAAGGTLTPSIAIGAAVGTVLGLVFQSFMPGIIIWQCALLGACSLLAASQQAPLMALLMIIEISHLGSSSFLALGLGVALSVGISKFVLVEKAK
ncbi:chloride channel protein [Liquorilactobacillus uvarum]|uniref:Chloride channel protein n=1 Tax=Liquorilactobacillus uvarum DSM 19971 TaxID=1423812 RepID=A0A0R1Q112_9LACO|nr:chloride channel protein [Liquorilactobacillus uvarum]KRL38140.1 hypothetical protein FD20_GL002088 [Liquorilactobacillus uvarum DSM 19971]